MTENVTLNVVRQSADSLHIKMVAFYGQTSKNVTIYYFFRVYFHFCIFPTKSLPDNEMLSLCTAYIPIVPHNSHLSEFLHLHWFSPYPCPRNQPITILPTYHPCLHGMLACRQADVNAFTYPLFHSQFAIHRNSIAILIEASSTFSFLLKFIFLPSLTYLFTQVFLFASTQSHTSFRTPLPFCSLPTASIESP
jgi:hypothetical protein